MEGRLLGEFRRAGVYFLALRHTEGADCVFDSMAGHRCNLRGETVSLIYVRGVSAPGEQRYASLTITIHVAVCTGLLPIAFDFLLSAFIAGSGHAPTLLHWHHILGGLSRGEGVPSSRSRCMRGALILQLPLRFRGEGFILILIF